MELFHWDCCFLKGKKKKEIKEQNVQQKQKQKTLSLYFTFQGQIIGHSQKGKTCAIGIESCIVEGISAFVFLKIGCKLDFGINERLFLHFSEQIW